MGLVPLDLLDLNQWSVAYGSRLSIWEIETLVSASRLYVEKHQAFDQTPAAAPYNSTDEARSDISDRVRDAFMRRSKSSVNPSMV